MPVPWNLQDDPPAGRVPDRALLGRMARYAAPHARELAWVVLLSAVVTGADVLRPYLFKVGIDRYLLGPPQPQAGWALAALAGVLLGLTVLSRWLAYVMAVRMQRVSQEVIRRLREQLFSHLQGRSLAFFQRHPAGRLVTRLTNDTEALSEFYGAVVVNLARDLLVLVGVAVALARLDPALGMVATACLVPASVLTWRWKGLMREAYRQVRARLARVNAFLAENLHGMWLVQAFAAQGRQLQRFREENEALRRAALRELEVVALFRPMVDLLAQLAVAAVVVYGGLRVLRGQVEYGVLFAAAQYVRQMFQPIGDLAEKWNVLQAAMAAAERIFQVLDDPTALPEPQATAFPADGRPGGAGAPALLRRAKGHLVLEGVWFAYQEPHWVLRDICLEARPGEMVAVVGPTGAGKSSLVNLLLRLYDPQRGRVLLDGVDLRELPTGWLRRQVACVLQEPFLFEGTVRSNVAVGLGEGAADGHGGAGDGVGAAVQAAVEAAARRAGVHEVLQSLPHGYDTPVFARGTGLSLGQRQLIALARAAACDAPVLVLDEATASVDSVTEQAIQESLARLRGSRTVVVVAHRLATVKEADRIVVLHRGRVHEVGTHRELVQARGLYWRLWTMQGLAMAAGTEAVAG
ncbi:MAG TPA: ABC transporter ATP-binding protein [Limnochordales bacterium]